MAFPVDLSVCMIVKNEADNLARSLESVAEIARQIVVVDTGSTDNTVDIARRYGAEVYFFPWNESFSDARNHSLAFARARWILIMDADDELVKEDIPTLKNLLDTEAAEAFFLRTINSNDPHGTHRGTHHLTLRLFRNRPQYRYVGRIHESIIPAIADHAGQQSIKAVPEVRIIHYGYSKQEVEQKNKIYRNLNLLTKELESRAPDSFLYYNLGVEYFRLGDYSKALEYFEQAEVHLRWEAAFAPSLVRKKADCLALLGRNREAIQYLEEKLGLYPDYTDLLYRLGLLHMENHDLVQATRCFHKCLSMGESPPHYPHEEGVSTYLAYQALGNTYELMLEKYRALNAYRCQLACKPTDLQPVASILRLLLAENSPDTAVIYLRTWFDFSTPAANLGVGDLFLLHYCPSAALEFLFRAADLGAPRDYYCALRGEALLLLGRYQEALSELAKVEKNSLYYLRALRNRCLLYWLTGCFDQAKFLIEHQWPPDAGRGLYLAAYSLLESSAHRVHFPLEDSTTCLGLYLDLMEKCIYLRRWDLVERLSTWAEELPELKPALGKILYRRGFHEEAAEWLEKGYQFALSAQDKEALLAFARILRKQRKYREAEKVLKAAIDQLPADLELSVELADLYHEQAVLAVCRVPGTDALVRALRTETRPRLSVCMIVKDEAEFLPRCLSSIRDIADEIVVVDTGSSDHTPQIAMMNGARLFRIKWTDDFAAARNFALDRATGDWILIIDADEELSPNDGDKIRRLMYMEEIEGVCVHIVNYYGQEAGPNFMNDIACRLFRNRPCYRFQRSLHEQVVDQIIARSGPSSVKIANIRILHYGYLTPVANRKKKLERNLPIIQKAILMDPQNKFLHYSLGVELLNAGRHEEAFLHLETSYQPGLSYSSDVVLKKAVCLKELSRFSEALSLIEESLPLYPQFTDLVFLQGEILFQLGQFEKASACFRQCLQLGDATVIYCGANGVGSFRAWDLLGQSLEALGRYQEAEQAYRQAMAANTKYHQPFYRWAHLLRRRQNAAEVVETLKDLVDLSDPFSLLLLADVLMSISDYQEAITFVQSAIKRAPTNRIVALRGLFMEGLCLAFLRRFTEASVTLERIPNNSQYYIPSLVWRYTLALASGAQDSAEKVLNLLIKADGALGQAYLIAHRLIFGQSGEHVSSNPDLIALLQEMYNRLISLQAADMANQVQKSLSSLATT